jgi:sec-independent protein translocase protein TatA
MFGLGPMELAVIGIIAVILFGRKLPDLARSMGKSVVAFKQGVSGLEEGINDVVTDPAAQAGPAPAATRPPQRVTATAPKFEETAANP